MLTLLKIAKSATGAKALRDACETLLFGFGSVTPADRAAMVEVSVKLPGATTCATMFRFTTFSAAPGVAVQYPVVGSYTPSPVLLTNVKPEAQILA